MSFLAPLYVLGVLAVAAPVVFHLIRRTPRGDRPFSSLMFLSPTPPRLTRRSRIDQWLLLLLRAAALCLLAVAFARPFLRQTSPRALGGASQRRLLVLIDTSASLRRGDLWSRAREAARQAVAAARPDDELAVYAFDASTRPVLGFAESAGLDPPRRRAVATARIDALAPTWGATHLGQALVDAATALEEAGERRVEAVPASRAVVLVSDLQQGSRLDPLREFEWPRDVSLELRTVTDGGTNAGLERLAGTTDAEPAADGPTVRVRVANDPGSRHDGFTLAWVDERGRAIAGSSPLPVHVPPGEGRVARLPVPPGSTRVGAIRLSGDSHGFDDTLHVATPPRTESTVLFIGEYRADDPAGLLYYLERALPDDARRVVRVVAVRPDGPLPLDTLVRVPLVVLATSTTTAANLDRLGEFARDGGTVLSVLTRPGPAPAVAALAGADGFETVEATVGRDALLGEIAFDHPLFAELAGAQFNDFTKVRFWKYRKVPPDALGASRVLARFDSGDPAIVEKPVDKGRLVVLTSGWAPTDSQLARSSKFVPLVTALVERPGHPSPGAESYFVHDRVPLPPGSTGAAVVHRPDGTTDRAGTGDTTYGRTNVPGVYAFGTPGGPWPFAVNLDPSESRTAPLAVETLEQLGCRLGGPARPPSEEQLRQMRGIELEGRQKLWRWLVLSAIAALIVETWLAGRLARTRPARTEVVAS